MKMKKGKNEQIITFMLIIERETKAKTNLTAIVPEVGLAR